MDDHTLHAEASAAPTEAFSPLTGTSLRIAVAGKKDETVSEHFGQAEGFLIYDVTGSEICFMERREIDAHAHDGEDKRETIKRMLGDCQALLVVRVGETPKEMMASAGIDATAEYADRPIAQSLRAYFDTRATAADASEQEEELADPSTFRVLHTMLRVSDMERSLDFYTRLLGMRVVEQREHKKNQFSQAYLAFGDAPGQTMLELVFNWIREEPYQMGDSYGHIAVGVTGIGALCRKLEAEGVPMPRPPKSQRHGNTIVAFVQDPDGYQIELVQTMDATP